MKGVQCVSGAGKINHATIAFGLHVAPLKGSVQRLLVVLRRSSGSPHPRCVALRR